MNDPYDALFGNRVEEDDATVESLEEIEIVFLRTLHVYNVVCVVVRLRVLVCLAVFVGFLVHRVDVGEAHCLSSFVLC